MWAPWQTFVEYDTLLLDTTYLVMPMAKMMLMAITESEDDRSSEVGRIEERW